jgi:hypothetical protein
MTSFRLSICVTREDAVRAELASRVSFEASCTVVSIDEEEWGLDSNTHGAYEFVKVYFTEVFQSVFDLRKSVF